MENNTINTSPRSEKNKNKNKKRFGTSSQRQRPSTVVQFRITGLLNVLLRFAGMVVHAFLARCLVPRIWVFAGAHSIPSFHSISAEVLAWCTTKVFGEDSECMSEGGNLEDHGSKKSETHDGNVEGVSRFKELGMW